MTTALDRKMDELSRLVDRAIESRQDDGLSADGIRSGTRSFGEFVARIAAGDEQATRAYTGATSGDFVLEDQWVGNLTQIIRARTPVTNAFSRDVLPETGLNVEYGYVDDGDDTTDVDVQATEGGDLVNGKVKVTTKQAAIVTCGGYSTMSRQAIERTSNVSSLDTTFTAMAEKYATAAEAHTRSAFDTFVSDKAKTVAGTLTSQDAVVSALIDLALHFQDYGRSLDGIFLDKATFKALAALEATKKILTVGSGDSAGDLTPRALTADLAGIPTQVLHNADANTFVAYDRRSLMSLESAGAPVRLQHDNVVNLSSDFGVYGYDAAYVQIPAGIVALDQS